MNWCSWNASIVVSGFTDYATMSTQQWYLLRYFNIILCLDSSFLCIICHCSFICIIYWGIFYLFMIKISLFFWSWAYLNWVTWNNWNIFFSQFWEFDIWKDGVPASQEGCGRKSVPGLPVASEEQQYSVYLGFWISVASASVFAQHVPPVLRWLSSCKDTNGAEFGSHPTRVWPHLN